MSRPSTEKVASYGRGGAGNIAREDPNAAQSQVNDLVTPTLKSDHYSTGRGGSGNIAKNDPNRPEIARASQDVEAPEHRDHEGPQHYGRGGAANVTKSSANDTQAAHEKNQRKSGEARRSSFANGDKGLVEKGKDLLNKLGKK